MRRTTGLTAVLLLAALPAWAGRPASEPSVGTFDDVLAWRRTEAASLADTRLAAQRSYLHLAEFYRARGLDGKAAELYLFGLLRNPDDVRMLRGILEIWVGQERYGEALPYAVRFAALAPSDPAARRLLGVIRAHLDAKNPGAVKQALAAAAAAGQGTATAAEPAAASVPATAAASATAVTTAPAAPAAAPSRQDKLRALRMMKAVAAAVTMYNLNHPTAKMDKLDLEKLKADKVLPAGLSLEPFTSRFELAGTSVAIKDLGDVAGLEKELADYQASMARYYGFIAKGEVHEALNQAESLAAAYPDETDAIFPRLFTLLTMQRGAEAERLARQVTERFKDRPRPLFELLMVQYRSGQYEGARVTASVLQQRFAATHWAQLAGEIGRLVDRNVGFDLLSNLIAARNAVVQSVERSKAQTAPAGDGSAGDETTKK